MGAGPEVEEDVEEVGRLETNSANHLEASLNIQNMQNLQNMQNMRNMQDIQNMQNMQIG